MRPGNEDASATARLRSETDNQTRSARNGSSGGATNVAKRRSDSALDRQKPNLSSSPSIRLYSQRGFSCAIPYDQRGEDVVDRWPSRPVRAMPTNRSSQQRRSIRESKINRLLYESPGSGRGRRREWRGGLPARVEWPAASDEMSVPAQDRGRSEPEICGADEQEAIERGR